MAWPVTSDNSGVMGSPAQVNSWMKGQSRKKNRNKGRSKGRSSGNNNAGRALFQRTLSRGSSRS